MAEPATLRDFPVVDATATDKADGTAMDKAWERLNAPAEIVRDPVHGDIELSATELDVVDLPVFQRLRGIRQLGPTNLVYPGALHARFDHSLGTLHETSRIVGVIRDRAKWDEDAYDLGPRDECLVRLKALLHDLAHIPYGHTLEDEGNFFDGASQWESEGRSSLLDDGSNLAEAVQDSLIAQDVPAENASSFWDDLKALVLADDASAYQANPALVDIVAGPLCADNIDYIKRDAFFTGLPERMGDRFVKYLAILNVTNAPSPDDPPSEPVVQDCDPAKMECRFLDGPSFIPHGPTWELAPEGQGTKRLVLCPYKKDRTGRTVESRSAVTEAIDFHRRRYSLTEKVYYHRTKRIASGMICEAYNYALESVGYEHPEGLIEWRDDDFHRYLAASESHDARFLNRCLLDRDLYSVAFEVSRQRPREQRSSSRINRDCRDPRKRMKLQEKLRDFLGFDHPVLIHYPNDVVNPRKFNPVVRFAGQATMTGLVDAVTADRRKETQVIGANHAFFWRCIVCVYPKDLHENETMDDVSRDIAVFLEENEPESGYLEPYQRVALAIAKRDGIRLGDVKIEQVLERAPRRHGSKNDFHARVESLVDALREHDSA